MSRWKVVGTSPVVVRNEADTWAFEGGTEGAMEEVGCGLAECALFGNRVGMV